MLVSYEAFVQVPYTTGFWMPHTEYECSSARCASLADAMNWLANNKLSYHESAQSYVDIRIDGRVEVSWEFSNGLLTTHVPIA